jgi:hypothetical protein
LQPAGRRREHVQALLAHVTRERLHTLLLRERQHTHTPSEVPGAETGGLMCECHYDGAWLAEALSFGQQLDAAPTVLLRHVHAANRMLAAADAQVAALQSAQLVLGVAHAVGGRSAGSTATATEKTPTAALLAAWSRHEVGACVMHAAHELSRAGAAAAEEPRAAALASQYTSLLLLLLRVWAAADEQESTESTAEAEGQTEGGLGPCVAVVRAVVALLRDEVVRAPHASSTSLASALLTVLLQALQLALRCVPECRADPVGLLRP